MTENTCLSYAKETDYEQYDDKSRKYYFTKKKGWQMFSRPEAIAG